MRLRYGLAKEPLGRGRISPGSQKEIDRLPSAVHRPIEIRPASLHPNVGFVHPPGAVAHSQMRAGSLFKLRCVGLDPSEDRRVVDLDSAVEEHEFQIAVADREHQIPSHGPKDRLSCELPPLETITQTHTDARPIVPPQSYGKSASSKVCNRTLRIMILQEAEIGIIAVGVTQVIIMGGIDLSSGSVVGMTAMIAASLAQIAGYTHAIYPSLTGLNPIFPVAAGLACG